MPVKIQRCWINCPSQQYIYHHIHGTNVIARLETRKGVSTVFFLAGKVISMEVETRWLSDGWIPQGKTEYTPRPQPTGRWEHFQSN